MSELLTQLQDQLHIVSKMFFDFVGILQRDAPPISVAGEAVLPSAQQHQQQQQQHAPGQPPPQFDVERTTQLMATQLIEQFKLTDALIRALPDERISAPDHSDRIRDLQREHDDVSRELEAAAREAEEQLAELQRMFAVLARQRLADAQQGLPLAPLPPMG